eukprot:881769-Pelagomonas_calceolata.AAC.3
MDVEDMSIFHKSSHIPSEQPKRVLQGQQRGEPAVAAFNARAAGIALPAAACEHMRQASARTDPLQAQRSPEDVLSQLLGVRAYDSAHRLALCAWPAGRQQQTRALEALAGAMAREAARLQLQGEGGGDAAGVCERERE